ncbi:unnamed protein product [Nezara viridula]|uniref:Uncharacterized protein n=1 Tax=Nezara viridula TaxID=85310 RepID=A0A9P0HNJ4_NEZVI|nr:unnamed protein product [Nezara viridula]
MIASTWPDGTSSVTGPKSTSRLTPEGLNRTLSYPCTPRPIGKDTPDGILGKDKTYFSSFRTTVDSTRTTGVILLGASNTRPLRLQPAYRQAAPATSPCSHCLKEADHQPVVPFLDLRSQRP